VSLKPEQPVHVWKESRDGWKRPADVAIIVRKISALSPSPTTPSSPVPVASTDSSSAGRPTPAPASSPSRLRVSLSGPKQTPGSSGSGPQVSKPGSAASGPPKPLPPSSSGFNAAPLSMPVPGPKVVPPIRSGSRPRAVPPPIPGSGHRPRSSVSGSGQELSSVVGSGLDLAQQRISDSKGYAGGNWPSLSLDLPHPTPAGLSAPGATAVTGLAPPAGIVPSAGPLFGNLASLPPAPLTLPRAESGLSKLTRLAGLAHRHRHIKYVIAASVVLVPVILLILLSWRAPSGKAATLSLERAAPVPELFPVSGEGETPPQDKNTVGRGAGHRGRRAGRIASRRSASGHSAGVLGRLAVAGEAPFEAPSGGRERAAPVVASGQSRPSRPGPSGGEGRGISQTQISEVVRNKENQSGLRTCYERALKRDGRLRTGRLDITVSIGESGTVQRVQVHGPADFMIIEDCIKSAIRHWRFPANAEEYATSFPLILQGG